MVRLLGSIDLVRVIFGLSMDWCVLESVNRFSYIYKVLNYRKKRIL
ncbi:hypothetical protein SAMN06295967_11328 [Belliella buryatensis]|uniref:Uncharacterized protein n=1 Tax=Belliella buryatensis TaxID=1500549 RepID=A0A239FLV8_9BACT|nr:hypothetical protein SAMN06295967_11328 [Belliella buryatensis]